MGANPDLHVAYFYSFQRVKQPGRITRLLACSEDQLKSYPKSLLEMGPTFVHANMRFDHVNDVEANDHDHFHRSTTPSPATATPRTTSRTR